MNADVTANAARVDPRIPASAVASITAVRLSPGDSARLNVASGMLVDLVNISRTGMLVEGRTRIVPGSRVTVMIEGTFQPSQFRAKVIRCQVTSISDGTLRYQCGIQFDQPLDRIPSDESAPAAAAIPSAMPGSPLPATATPAAAPGGTALVNRW
jgi:hypothetical protein